MEDQHAFLRFKGPDAGWATSPTRVLPATQAWPLFDAAHSRSMEVRALAAKPAVSLMQRAGLSVARLVAASYPLAKDVWVAAGPGGNGGDGLHAAADLAQAGRRVSVTLLADPDQLGAEAAAGWRRCQALGIPMLNTSPGARSDVAIDALLGLGSSRAPTGALAQTIDAMNGLGVPVLAVDLPSGLCPDSGASLGGPIVKADSCLSLLTLKPGLFTAKGRAHAGEIWFDNLGVETEPGDQACARLSHPLDLARARPGREHDTHKGSFGDVMIVGGAPGMVGAARLAAHAAQAAGAGRTFVSLLDEELPPGDVSRPEWLWPARAWNWDGRRLAPLTVVCGCGGGDEVVRALPPLLEQAGALVLDADALNAIARDPALETLLSDRAGRGQATVLTPHPLEAARLLGRNTAEVQADRLAAAQTLSRRLHAVVVLKGSGTVICSPGASPVINSTGNAALASGGTGDVLAGWLGGLWAACRGTAGREAAVWDLAQRCAVAAVWLHGQAADTSPLQAARALDLVGSMRTVAAQAQTAASTTGGQRVNGV
jgi:ADP-dependent NAD(P)H-hydrate dehydratase / NAD(P)H-hydrate epimerase